MKIQLLFFMLFCAAYTVLSQETIIQTAYEIYPGAVIGGEMNINSEEKSKETVGLGYHGASVKFAYITENNVGFSISLKILQALVVEYENDVIGFNDLNNYKEYWMIQLNPAFVKKFPIGDSFFFFTGSGNSLSFSKYSFAAEANTGAPSYYFYNYIASGTRFDLGIILNAGLTVKFAEFGFIDKTARFAFSLAGSFDWQTLSWIIADAQSPLGSASRNYTISLFTGMYFGLGFCFGLSFS